MMVIDGVKGTLQQGLCQTDWGFANRQQGGEQIKKTERQKKSDKSREGWREIAVNSQGVYRVCVCVRKSNNMFTRVRQRESKCVPTCYVTCLQG